MRSPFDIAAAALLLTTRTPTSDGHGAAGGAGAAAGGVVVPEATPGTPRRPPREWPPTVSLTGLGGAIVGEATAGTVTSDGSMAVVTIGDGTSMPSAKLPSSVPTLLSFLAAGCSSLRPPAAAVAAVAASVATTPSKVGTGAAGFGDAAASSPVRLTNRPLTRGRLSASFLRQSYLIFFSQIRLLCKGRKTEGRGGDGDREGRCQAVNTKRHRQRLPTRCSSRSTQPHTEVHTRPGARRLGKNTRQNHPAKAASAMSCLSGS